MSKENLRKCVGCGVLAPKSEMIKITKLFSENEIVINPNSKTFGRSAYLCYNQNCIEKALKKNKINKVLKTTAQLQEDSLYKLLENRKGQLDG